MMNLRDLFERELARHNILWCKRCDGGLSHRRGWASLYEERTIHLDSAVQTRSTLYRGLHEIGHLVRNQRGMRRHEKERQANEFAERRLRELGIPVPRNMANRSKEYVSRMKRWGRNISRARD